MISLHLSKMASAIGPKIGPGFLVATASAFAVLDVNGGPMVALFALAGSAGAELFRFISRDEPPLETFWRLALETLTAIFLGFLIGCGVGPSFARWISADAMAGALIMGLAGYGLIRTILSPGFIERIADMILKGGRNND